MHVYGLYFIENCDWQQQQIVIVPPADNRAASDSQHALVHIYKLMPEIEGIYAIFLPDSQQFTGTARDMKYLGCH